MAEDEDTKDQRDIGRQRRKWMGYAEKLYPPTAKTLLFYVGRVHFACAAVSVFLLLLNIIFFFLLVFAVVVVVVLWLFLFITKCYTLHHLINTIRTIKFRLFLFGFSSLFSLSLLFLSVHGRSHKCIYGKRNIWQFSYYVSITTNGTEHLLKVHWWAIDDGIVLIVEMFSMETHKNLTISAVQQQLNL